MAAGGVGGGAGAGVVVVVVVVVGSLSSPSTPIQPQAMPQGTTMP